MYKCKLCGEVFDTPKNYSEDLTPGGAFEGNNFIYEFSGCPECSCNDYEEITDDEEYE